MNAEEKKVLKERVFSAVENVLQETFGKDYHGLDDDMWEAYEMWVAQNIIEDPEMEDIAKIIN
jgi:hypothetical protein